MEKIIQVNTDYTIRTELQNGVNHIVVPVVMMIEGVHEGSHGALLHLTKDLGRHPEAWNSMPVTIQHPQEDGHNVSANSPEMIASQSVGRIYNTHMDGDKLKAEVWLDEARLQELSAEALEYIRQGEPLEVSIGVFTDEDNTPGKFRGVPYEAIARNHRPDHLALLPGAEGACSWTDGCGIRNNNKKGENGVNKDEVFAEGKTLLEVMKSLSKKGLVVTQINNNEQGYRTLVQSIQTKLDSMDNDFRTYYLQEVFEDHFIYEVRKRDEGSTLYKDGYEVQTDETVDFAEEPTEVRRDVKYVTMSLKRTNFNNNQKKEGKTMSKKEETPCKITALINNELTKFTEDDREWLKTLEEAVLDKLIPNEPKPQANKKAEEDKGKALQIDAKQTKQEPKKELTLNEYLEGVPEGIRDSMRTGLKLHEEQRETMTKEILANTEKGVWDEEDLKVMKTDILKKVFDSVKKEEVDFSVLSTHGTEDAGKPGLLLPPGIKEESKKN